jgi:hypothetical protein
LASTERDELAKSPKANRQLKRNREIGFGV